MAGFQLGNVASYCQNLTSSPLKTTGAAIVLIVGALTLLSRIYQFLRVLLSIYIVPGKSLQSFGPRGSWAVITGASDGLGKEFALQISKQGFNLLLVSRTKSKLDALASEIMSQYSSIRVETIAMDFSANDPTDYARVSKAIADRHVSILINNVGQSHSIPVPFVETSATEMDNIININCFGTLKITQLILPSMLQRKRGLIMTMGSLGGQLPTPLLGTYSGSKAFLQAWSTALAGELRGSGVTVHFVHAYLVVSAMSKVRRASALIPNARPFVKAALSKIGRRGGSVGYANSGSPYWSHAWAMWAIWNVTSFYGGLAQGINLNMHKGIRRAALRKQERERAKVAAEGKKAA